MAWMTRFFTAVAFLAVGVIFSPETFGSKSDGNNSPLLITLLKLAHLLCFSTAWGAALWVTFIGGIIMFKNLPRHQFGNLQSKMFPAYFSMVGVCCAIAVGAFGYLHPWKTSGAAEKYQLGFLVAAFSFNLSNLIIFTPMTIEMMKQRHKIEREANIGEEVGWTKNQEVAKKNPKLASMNKKFGMIHGLSSLANILSFGSLAIHSCSVDDKPMKMSHGGGKEYLVLVAGLEKSLRSLNASVGQPMLTKASNSTALSTSFRLSINNAEKRPTNKG
ncbi:UNVERIFIED_CONTAM: Transmembrane protein [Sesamum angustifolium]|uniref:Transmembrane protein n=1 Tax=Sesamum angustifolium TaxID=2727405 RepID=A0AAW2QU90_9LAMI